MSRTPTSRRPPRSAHDAYFKWLLGVPENAGRLMREHLPAEAAALLAPGPPELVRETFVDSRLDRHLADVLYRVRLAGGEEAYVHVLFEHKSEADRLTRLQVLGYMVRIWEWWRRSRRRGAQGAVQLPLVIPIVIHHGSRAWSHPTAFGELFGAIPAALAPFAPAFRHVLIDLARIEDGKLSSDPKLRAQLLVLKRIQAPDLEEHVTKLLVEVLVLDRMALEAVLSYLSARIEHGRLIVAMEAAARSRQGENMSDFMEFLKERFGAEARAHALKEGRAAGLAEGRAAGRAEGREKGVAEGKATTLARQLTRRFGPLSEATRREIAEADGKTLDRWLDRVLDAPDLASVFATRKKS